MSQPIDLPLKGFYCMLIFRICSTSLSRKYLKMPIAMVISNIQYKKNITTVHLLPTSKHNQSPVMSQPTHHPRQSTRGCLTNVTVCAFYTCCVGSHQRSFVCVLIFRVGASACLALTSRLSREKGPLWLSNKITAVKPITALANIVISS